MAARRVFSSTAKTWPLQNTKALGELHEGLGFSCTGVENVDILGFEPRVRGWIRDPQMPEDAGDRLRWRREITLLDDGRETSHQAAPFS
jgi:hypothetical protein